MNCSSCCRKTAKISAPTSPGCVALFHDADHGVAIAALVEQREARRRGERRVCALLDDRERACCEPAAGSRRSKRPLAESLAVGWIGKQKAEGLHGADLTERGRVAAEDLAAP